MRLKKKGEKAHSLMEAFPFKRCRNLKRIFLGGSCNKYHSPMCFERGEGSGGGNGKKGKPGENSTREGEHLAVPQFHPSSSKRLMDEPKEE